MSNTPYMNAVYYPSWLIYKGHAPSSLNIDVITHIFYAFCRPQADGSILLLDEYADLQKPVDGTKGCIAACIALKKKHPSLKVLLSIGGGSGSQHFAALASNPALRDQFSQAAALLVRTHSFDGVDFPAPHYLLTTALPVGDYVLKHINLRVLAGAIDLLNLMAYDFAGAWSDGLSGHHAQLLAPAVPYSGYAKKSGKGAVEYVLAQGVAAKKILLGVPVYGRSFLGVEGPGQRFSKCGGRDGTWLYSELPRPGTVEMVDWEVGGAWCVGDGEWVSYDSVDTVRMKGEYVNSVGIGGLFYWTGVADKTGDESLIASGWKGLRGT